MSTDCFPDGALPGAAPCRDRPADDRAAAPRSPSPRCKRGRQPRGNGPSPAFSLLLLHEVIVEVAGLGHAVVAFREALSALSAQLSAVGRSLAIRGGSISAVDELSPMADDLRTTVGCFTF